MDKEVIKREQLLDAVEQSKKELRVYEKKCSPYDPIFRVQRLLRYRGKYIRYIGTRLVLFLNSDVRAKTFWGRELLLPLRDMDAFVLYFFGILGGAEYKLTKFLIKNLRPDGVFYDIGANYGFYTYLAQEMIADGEVHSFEPLPNVFSYLERNAHNYDRTFLNNIALSDRSGSISFFDGSLGRHSGGSTTKEIVASSDLKKYRKIEVETSTLQDYTKSHTMPTIMKIDVEGGEAEVIKGGINIFERSRPIVIMEVWSGDKQPISMKAVEKLRNAGYREVCRINEDGDLERITTDDFFVPPFQNLRHDNFVFLKGE